MERYRDRKHAGALLAKQLGNSAGRPETIVLGLPRGGLPVADEVARALHAPLDIVVVRKVGAPSQPEVAMGAIAAVAGTTETVYNEDVMGRMGSERSERAFEEVAARELVELERRERTYRAGRPPLSLTNSNVILVDDGLATGATMRAAITAVRSQNPAHIQVAVPVGLGNACRDAQELADDVVCLWVPDQLHSVGQAYENFDQTTDEEVREILSADRAGNRG